MIVTSGTSNIVANPTITQVWGAMVGRSDNSATAPYNNCNSLSKPDDDFEGCNPSRVNGNHSITIEFTETENLEQLVPPIAVIKQINSGGAGGGNNVGRIKVVRIPDPQQSRSGTNQRGILSFTWADLCSMIEIDGTSAVMQVNNTEGVNRCINPTTGFSVSGSFIVTIGFQINPTTQDTNSNVTLPFYLYSTPLKGEPGEIGTMPKACPSTSFGFCDITPFPGDGGGTVNPPTGFTERTNKLAGGVTFSAPAFDAFGATANLPLAFEKLRLYLSSINFTNAHPSVDDPDAFRDLLIDAPNSSVGVTFREDDFGGLVNGTSYIIRAATVDVSGTVSQLFNNDFCPVQPGTPANCPDYTITPSEIAGLIAESSCFITSATYGSPQAAQVKIFRDFRAKYLWTNSLGKKISNTYNKYGPIGAKWIYQNPSSKKIVRIALYPFYGFAFLSVHYGFSLAVATYLFGLVMMTLGFIKIFSKVKSYK